MAKFKVSPNLEVYNKKIYELGAQAQTYIENAVKKGGDVVADAVRAGINGIPVDDSYAVPGHMRSGIRSIQKTGLQSSFGVAPVRNDKGFINVKVGFDGYNGLRTKAFPSGQPNSMVARSVENGSSFMQASPFMNQAVQGSRQQAEDTMKQEIEQSIGEIMGV